jgi:hypothetical protein
VLVHGEDEFLVFGADTELRLGLAARLEPGDEFVARLDWGHVDLVTSHAGTFLVVDDLVRKPCLLFGDHAPAQKGRDVKHGEAERAM